MVTDHYFVISTIFLLLLNYTTEIPLSNNLDEEKDHFNEVCMSDSRSNKRAVTRIRERIWKKAIVPYTFISNYNDDEKKILQDSMNIWMNKTCIQFKPHTSEVDYIEFTKILFTCAASVGNAGGRQLVNLHSFCFNTPGAIVHELGHVLGLWHEHTRPDRDDFIEVIWENIESERRYLFNIQSPAETQSFKQMYDYYSIMHYPLDAFSINDGNTLQPKKNVTGEIGYQKRLIPSDNDYLQLRYLYGCQPYYEPQNGSGQPAVFLTDNINWNKYSSTSSLNEESHSVSNMTLSIYQALSNTIPLTTQSHPMSKTSTQETSSQEISLVATTISHFMSKEDSSFQEMQLATTTVSHSVSAQEASTTVSHFVSFQETAKYFISSSLAINPTPTLMSTHLSSSSSQSHILSTTFAIMPSTSNISSLQSNSTFVVYSSKDVATERNQPTPILLPPITSGRAISLTTEYRFGNKNYCFTCEKSRCYTKSFSSKQHENCESTKLSLIKLKDNINNQTIKIGDQVIITPYHELNSMVTCGIIGACRLDYNCPKMDMYKRKCQQHILYVFSPGKDIGEPIRTNDLIELRHNWVTSDLQTSWIGCDPSTSKKCRKDSCKHDETCQIGRFYIHIL